MTQFFIHKQNVPLFGAVETVVAIGYDGIVWWLPSDEGNALYSEYLRWVAEGNTAPDFNPEGSATTDKE